jgi:hypothetical protein
VCCFRRIAAAATVALQLTAAAACCCCCISRHVETDGDCLLHNTFAVAFPNADHVRDP